MKEIAIAAVALLLGIVLGGIGPRSELKVFEDRLEGRVETAQKCNSGVGRDLAAFMGSGIGKSEPPAKAPLPAPETLAQEDRVADLGEAGELDAMPEGELPLEDHDHALGEHDELLSQGPAESEIEAARTALELRRTQARAALVEHTDPDTLQLASFDRAINDMNAVLLGMTDELGEMFGSGAQPNRRDAMEFAADALDTLLASEDAMRSSFDADQLEGLPDSAVDPFSYVDPAIVDVLAQLEQVE